MHVVRITGPAAVTVTVCSKCADRLPSRVTASGPVILTTLNGGVPGGASGSADGPAAPGVNGVETPGKRESRWRKRTR